MNNLYRFRPLQAEVSILPITIAKENEMVKQYRENATFGIGKIEAIVAAGIKQRHIADRAKLERVLDLDNILKPLRSSHTQSFTKREEEEVDINMTSQDEEQEVKLDGK